jgi:hypothetical protein
MALGLGAGPASRAQPSFFLCPYSPKCLEEEFCELRTNGVLGSSLADRKKGQKDAYTPQIHRRFIADSSPSALMQVSAKRGGKPRRA